MQGKIVYAYVVADYLHIGHVHHLENAKNLAGLEGKLIVGVLTDEATMEKKSKPVWSFGERFSVVKALRCVDCVVAQSEYSPLKNVMAINPDILIESSSHEKQPANEYMLTHGKQVIVLPYYPEQSSTNIKNKIIES
jgi:D-beta-D-heptose 7-phosphate kinase/D-beta-D-heptose 1-phosphate adenosyltransferase